MATIKENVAIQILKFWPVKYLIVLLLCLLVFSGFYHFYRCHAGLNSRFLWGAAECMECKPVINKTDTIVSHEVAHDTIKMVGYTEPKTTTSSRSLKNTPKQTEQKNVNGKNEANENNGTNNGIIGGEGNSVNNYGIIPRIFTEDDLSVFFSACPEKNTHITFVFAGSPDGEMISVKNKIKKLLQKKGYTNFDKSDATSFFDITPENVHMEKQNDGSVWFVIPPAK